MTDLEERTESLAVASRLVIHKLKNSLSVISGYAELILKEESLPEIAETGTERIYDTCYAMSALIDDAYEFFRIETGQMQLCPAAVNLSPVVEQVAAFVAMRVGEDISIESEIAPELVVWADPIQVIQILSHLLVGVAGKAERTDGDCSMTVRAWRGENAVYVGVSTSEGIPHRLGAILAVHAHLHERNRHRPGAFHRQETGRAARWPDVG